MMEAIPLPSTWWRPTPYPVHDGGHPLTQYMMKANSLPSTWWRPTPYQVPYMMEVQPLTQYMMEGQPRTQYMMEANPLPSTWWRSNPLLSTLWRSNPLPSTWWRSSPYPVHDGGPALHGDTLENGEHGEGDVVEGGDSIIWTLKVWIWFCQ